MYNKNWERRNRSLGVLSQFLRTTIIGVCSAIYFLQLFEKSVVFHSISLKRNFILQTTMLYYQIKDK